MNQNFFNFPTSWVAEMNKQAQPKPAPALLLLQLPPEQVPTTIRRKGRPAGSKNKPKAK